MKTDNVILFRPKQEKKFNYESEVVPFDAEEYLEHCKGNLIEEDYQAVLCAILDSDYYDMLDEVLKDIVDTYLGLD